MKTITLLIFTIFLGRNCTGETSQEIQNAVIEYTSNTRGFYYKITIQNEKLFVNKNRDSKEKGDELPLSNSDWKEIVKQFEDVDLEQLNTYKDPTQKRFYDGAAIATLKVNYKDKEYQTVDFDHGYPPIEIEDLVNKITSLVKIN
jgi:hypothetical protein